MIHANVSLELRRLSTCEFSTFYYGILIRRWQTYLGGCLFMSDT